MALRYALPRVSVTVKTCPERPARTATAIQFPVVLFAGNASVEEVTEPASLPACWTSLIAAVPDWTVKSVPLLATPPTVTMTLPVAAPTGTGAMTLEAPQLVGAELTPLKVTVLVPWDAPKFAPKIVTEEPIAPADGLRLLMLGGGGGTVKFTPLLAMPATVTTTLPVVAPAGTGTTMLVALQLVGNAKTPLNATVLDP